MADDSRLADMERDHRAINHMMDLILNECRRIDGNAVALNNIRYCASQAKEWSGRYCSGQSP